MRRHLVPARVTIPTGVAIAAGLCAAAIELLPAGNPARAAGALLLVLLLPGIALLGASGASRPPGRVEGFAWQAGLSIAVTILVTMLLYTAGVKLELGSWTVAMAGLTALACAIWVMRTPIPTATPAVTSGPTPAWSPRLGRPSGGRLRHLALLAITLMLLSGAAAVTVHSVSDSNAASRFTQLWILPAEAAGSIRIGVANHEDHDQTYALEVWRGRREVVNLPALRVDAQASWTRLVSIRAGSGRVDVKLRRGGSASRVYRQVYLTARAAGSSSP